MNHTTIHISNPMVDNALRCMYFIYKCTKRTHSVSSGKSTFHYYYYCYLYYSLSYAVAAVFVCVFLFFGVFHLVQQCHCFHSLSRAHFCLVCASSMNSNACAVAFHLHTHHQFIILRNFRFPTYLKYGRVKQSHVHFKPTN